VIVLFPNFRRYSVLKLTHKKNSFLAGGGIGSSTYLIKQANFIFICYESVRTYGEIGDPEDCEY